MNKKIAGAAIIIGLLAFTAINNSLFSVINTNEVNFDDCQKTEEWDIKSCLVQGEQLNELGETFTWKDDSFDLVIDDFPINSNEQPVAAVWLYQNGFAANQEKLEEVNMGDVKGGKVVDSLEKASTCTATLDLGSHGWTAILTDKSEKFSSTVKYAQWNGKDDDGDGLIDEGLQRYSDEPDENERQQQYLMQKATVTTQDIDVDRTTGMVACNFNASDFLNKGMELEGKFREWDGRTPIYRDEPGTWASIKVDFEVDRDKDGVLAANDKCENTSKGTHVNVNGCGNAFKPPAPDSLSEFLEKVFVEIKNVFEGIFL